MKRLILASNSPRRREILTEAGFDIEIIPSTFEENISGKTPDQTVKDFAHSKAKEVFDRLGDKDAVVLGADTVVSLEGVILGKPKNEQDAVNMLTSLSGKAHQVWTGYCIYSSQKVIVEAVKTDVIFNDLSTSKIEQYVATGKPLDKAGAYGIQDGFDLVKGYNGSYFNVVGLPLEEIQDKLKQLLIK